MTGEAPELLFSMIERFNRNADDYRTGSYKG